MTSVDDIEYDEYCDPKNPRIIKYEDILAASRRIVGAVIKTPCTKSHMSEKLGMELYLKQECLQYTGCFKERGVRNTLLLLSDEQKKWGVIAASTGNHALAMSYHTTKLGIPCAVVMPLNAPITKVTKCERFGVKTLLYGDNMAEAKHFAMAMAKEKKLTYINGYDHPNVIEGQGTTGIEIVQQVPAVDAVLVPCGGGSLLTGVAIAIKHLKPDTEVYGIGTERCYSMMEALKRNGRVKLEIDSSIADGLAVNMVGVNTFHNIRNGGLVDKMIMVKEEWVARAIMHVVESERFVIEGASAVGIASIMAGLLTNLKGKRVVCLITGGNIDTTTLARVLERGMAAEGRLVKFKVTIGDRPGGMAELCSRLAEIGVSVRDYVPERAWVKSDIFSTQVKILCETRGWDHAAKLTEMIKKHYTDYVFTDVHGHQKMERRRGPCLAPNPTCMKR